MPCRAVGGDLFDYIELPGGRFVVALGDVAGKGFPAALLMCGRTDGLLGALARRRASIDPRGWLARSRWRPTWWPRRRPPAVIPLTPPR